MSMIHRFLAVGLITALVGAAVAADDEPQTITAGELTFKAPGSWKKEHAEIHDAQGPDEGQRPSTGDDDPAELVVTIVPRQRPAASRRMSTAGRRASSTPTRRPPRPRSTKKKGINVEVTRRLRSSATTSPR